MKIELFLAKVCVLAEIAPGRQTLFGDLSAILIENMPMGRICSTS
jgi:hypothetical protein